jgi:hypothetical protein
MDGKQESQASISGSEFFKSLGKLEAFAKGAEDSEDLDKSQLFHTSSSEKTAWPGGKKHGIGNNWDDSIGTDGTDYKAARKSVAEKVLKGEPLTPEDIALLKSDAEKVIEGDDVAKGEGQEVEDGGGKGAPGKEGQEVCKSISEDNDTLQKGIEMSPFLAELVKAIDQRFAMAEDRQNDNVIKAANSILENLGEYLESRFEQQGEFNKSLAEVVTGIGHGLSANIQQTEEMAQAPAAAPKSTLRAVDAPAPIEKSFAGPEGGGGEELSKGQILGAMADKVEKGQLNALEVIKYENTGQIRPDLLQQIKTDITAAAQ